MNLLYSIDDHRSAQVQELEGRQALHVKFDFHGVRAVIYTNSSYIRDHMRLGYSFFETEALGEPHISLLALEAGEPLFAESLASLFPDRKMDDHVLVAQQLGLIFTLRTPPLLAYYTVKNLFSQVVFLLRKRFVALHAATLSCDGRGLILCGAARCGKTLLSTLLLEQDCSYSSDDVTLITMGSLKVAPFPRALTIREEYESLVAPLLAGARQVKRFKIADQERLLVALDRPVPEEVDPQVICLPNYEPNGKTRLYAMSPAIMLAALMHHRFYPLTGSLEEYDHEDFDLFSRLLERVACYQLVYADPQEAAHILKGTISQEEAGR